MVLALALPAASATRYVRPDGTGDFPTIQAAVDAARDDDEILLADGTFRGEGNRGIVVFAKALTIRSQSGDAATCIVDCEGVVRGFDFQWIPPAPCSLEAITVTNGGNDQVELGGGVHLYHASLTVRGCIFRENTAWEGGAIMGGRSSPLIEQCLFVGNRATLAPGGAVYFGDTCAPTIRSCTFAGNEALQGPGGAISCTLHSTAALEHCIVYGNVGRNAVDCWFDSSVSASCTNIFGNIGGDWVDCIADQANLDGNLSADPLFCGPDDFTLQADSPCAPPGPTGCGLIGALPVGCDVVAITPMSWGTTKARHRR
jgi:hypothetical protein